MFIPRFKFFVVVVTVAKGKVFFFIFFPEIPLLVYKNSMDFHTLILCPETLQCLLIVSNRFLVEYLEFSLQRFMLAT